MRVCERILAACSRTSAPVTLRGPMPLDSRRISRSRTCARTMPASEFRSAMAMAERPSAAARSTISSGWLAPVRKVKLVVAASSTCVIVPYLFQEAELARSDGNGENRV